MSRRALSATALTLVLAIAPATAFADGAGDDQYQDPLAAPTTPKTTQKKASSTPVTSTPAATTAPAAATAPASSSATAVADPAAGQLPRTGAPAGLIGLCGAALMASGIALRRRTAR